MCKIRNESFSEREWDAISGAGWKYELYSSAAPSGFLNSSALNDFYSTKTPSSEGVKVELKSSDLSAYSLST